MLSVESPHTYFIERAAVETANIDAKSVGIRSGDVEGFNATKSAKQMLRHVGIERVGRQRFFTLQQLEA
jgi:hypothetical protein